MKAYLAIIVFFIQVNLVFASLTSTSNFESPSLRQINKLPSHQLDSILYGATTADLNLFNDLISHEHYGFIGYHAAPQAVRVYQDIIKIYITEILGIPIRDDFQFLRIPGDSRLNYNNAKEFLEEYNIYKSKVMATAKKIILQSQSLSNDGITNTSASNNTQQSNNLLTFEKALEIINNYSPQKTTVNLNKSPASISSLQQEIKSINDMTYEIQTKLLSLNIALYQTEFGHYPLTVNAYIYNTAYSSIQYKLSGELVPFFNKLGIESSYIDQLFDLAQKYVPRNRGIIIRISDNQNNYKFIDTHGYISHPFGMPLGYNLPSFYYMDNAIFSFPELKIIMSNKHSVNPLSDLSITRYGSISTQQSNDYKQALTAFIKKIPYDKNKAAEYRQELLQLWSCSE